MPELQDEETEQDALAHRCHIVMGWLLERKY